MKLLCLVILTAFTPPSFAEEAELSPAKKYLVAIESRQKIFEHFRDKFYQEDVCPGLDYNCALNELKIEGIQSSADLNNGISLLSWIVQKKFSKGDCLEVCKMNLYAEYSVALIEFLSMFDRKKTLISLFPSELPETRSLVVNEELRFYKEFVRLHNNLINYRKKIDTQKIFRADLAKRIENIQPEIDKVSPSKLLKGSYLSSIKVEDEAAISSENRDLVSMFRADVR